MQQALEKQPSVAYFSMEVGLQEKMHTYSGGLGVLAGDTIRAAADLRVPMVAVTLLHRKGYFNQVLDADGWQREQPAPWDIDKCVKEMPERVHVQVEGRDVALRAWQYEVAGIRGFNVPVYFLDTDLPGNSAFDRTLTDYLYGGDQHYRLCQEVVLGIGGVRILRALGYTDIRSFHLNEGHAALLTLELLDEEARKAGRKTLVETDKRAVRRNCVFTTHTPVPAGHDQFNAELAKKVIKNRDDFFGLKDVLFEGKTLHMTRLALNLSRYVNGVARRHGEVSQMMFKSHSIESITNGVHAHTWTSEPFRRLFEKYIPNWKQDNLSLRSALSIPRRYIWEAHALAKRRLLQYVNDKTGIGMQEHIFTLGFARRASTYKRADLLFQDIERLKLIAQQTGDIQIIYAGKAHPADDKGKLLIKRVFQAKKRLQDKIRVVYLDGYNLTLGGMMTSGVDLWLNTPMPPLEASGTSGMKAAINGVPNLSILDGWWIEGHIEGLTGWSIGEPHNNNGEPRDDAADADSLYEKLHDIIIPMFYRDRAKYIDIMAFSIGINGAFFNTHRMMQEYVLNAYFVQ